MFAQLIASRTSRRRSPAGFAASVALHGIIVAGAVLMTSRTPTRHAQATELVVTYVAPARNPRAPVVPTRPSTPQLPATPGVIDVPLNVPDVIPPENLLRAAINTDQPFVFRVGTPAQVGTAGPDPDDPGAALSEDQVEVQVTLDPRSPMPRYPQLLRDAGVEGMARLRFVVDTLGHVESGTVLVLESTHPAFAVSAQAALRSMRFTPARVGNHRVRQLVEFPLQFRLKR
jgi:protein TonB